MVGFILLPTKSTQPLLIQHHCQIRLYLVGTETLNGLRSFNPTNEKQILTTLFSFILLPYTILKLLLSSPLPSITSSLFIWIALMLSHLGTSQFLVP